jgi:hypothetical protein
MTSLDEERILRNEEVTGLVAEIPAGHRHVRTTLTMADGTALTLQEATVAAIVRAYVAVKTDPARTQVVMRGTLLAERKPGFAEWQLIEA